MGTPKPKAKSSEAASPPRSGFVITLILLVGALGIFFYRSFDPNQILFSNDAPLGAMSSTAGQLPTALTGCWLDLNSVGTPVPAAGPTFTTLFRLVTNSPILFSKFFCPFVLLVLGICAWISFRLLGLSPAPCCLGSLAVALNSAYFSTGCWGIGTVVITIAMTFVAIGFVASPRFRGRWVSYALAGLAVGLGIMEGYDVGALYSVCLAAFVFYLAIMERFLPAKAIGNNEPDHAPPEARSEIFSSALKGVGRVTIIAVCAGLVAAHGLNTLIGTQIKGIAGTAQKTESKERQWAFATQWSLPKREALGILVPGVFGFRQRPAPNDGTDYWGLIGSDLSWDHYLSEGRQGPPPGGMLRLSGGGPYAGVIVVLVAAWAALQSFRKRDSIFAPSERQILWFWTAAFIIALLLAFGRFAPFYKLIYALPYSATVRNPAKFLHIVTLSLLMLFAFGVQGLYRHYFAGQVSKEIESKTKGGSKLSLGSFDRKWTIGCAIAIGLSVIGWLIYSASRTELIAYLRATGFPNESTASSIAAFSLRQVGWFLFLLTASVTLLTCILRGVFKRSHTGFGTLLFGALLVGDLITADRPWVAYWDWKDKYATNPILEQLREEPYENRVAIFPIWLSGALRLPPEMQQVEQVLIALYDTEWKQHHFPLFNIQTLDVVQMSRKPADLDNFDQAMFPGTLDRLWLLGRQWQLTGTRYIIGSVFWEREVLNQAIDPRQRFHMDKQFAIGVKPDRSRYTGLEDLTASLSTNGNYALFEFDGALPRAGLYANWQIHTNGEAVLRELTSPAFDPKRTVLLSEPLAGNPSPSGTNEVGGSVEFASYTPRHIVLKTKVERPSVLLLNDKYDSNWHVRVDGKADTVFRANYLMRGVYLKPGEHTVEFEYKPGTTPLLVSLVAISLSLALLGYVVVSEKRQRDQFRQSAGK